MKGGQTDQITKHSRAARCCPLWREERGCRKRIKRVLWCIIHKCKWVSMQTRQLSLTVICDMIYGEASSYRGIILVWNGMYIMCATQGSLFIEN